MCNKILTPFLSPLHHLFFLGTASSRDYKNYFEIKSTRTRDGEKVKKEIKNLAMGNRIKMAA